MPGSIVSGDRVENIDELMVRAARAATGLEALGVTAGDTVALCLRNDIATFEAGGAAGLVGAYAVPINWHLAPEEASYILRDCAARVLVIVASVATSVSQYC